ncbi:expressed unknown protein [Seminavis robusta]|uniref:Uncharacterized protein n=1 Tax=Seminavis robusta TaxID=568900 RepID=A0A9N8DY86_9STRA|nr:expressed unknown protein [Seminavis robusta]|eukprot:Sro363_g126860.1 n/a (332) ;mRNA; r:26773-27943
MADEKGYVKRELLDLTGVPMVESYGTLVEQKFKYNTDFKEILWRVLFILVKGPMQLVQHRATDGRWLQHAHIFIFICETHLPALADWGYWFVANIDQKSRDIQVLIGNDNKCGHASLYYLFRYAYWCTGSKRKTQIMDDILEKTHPTTKKSLKRKLKKLFKDDAERAQVKGLQRPDKFPGQDQFDLTATVMMDSLPTSRMQIRIMTSTSDFDADVPVSRLESIHLVVELQDTSTTKKDNENASLKVRLYDVLDEKEALADKAERLEKQLEIEKREKKEAVAALEMAKREKELEKREKEMEKREKEALEDKVEELQAQLDAKDDETAVKLED